MLLQEKKKKEKKEPTIYFPLELTMRSKDEQCHSVELPYRLYFVCFSSSSGESKRDDKQLEKKASMR